LSIIPAESSARVAARPPPPAPKAPGPAVNAGLTMAAERKKKIRKKEKTRVGPLPYDQHSNQR